MKGSSSYAGGGDFLGEAHCVSVSEELIVEMIVLLIFELFSLNLTVFNSCRVLL